MNPQLYARVQRYRDQDKPVERLFWNIGDVAEMLGVATSKLRYYEKAISLPSPKRGGSGNRKYRSDEIVRLGVAVALAEVFKLDYVERLFHEGREYDGLHFIFNP